MKHIFIINYTAGDGSKQPELRERIERIATAEHADFLICMTRGVGDAYEYIKNFAVNGEPTRFYLCGGDGTLREAVNAAMERGSDVEIGVIPCGTGNDFVRAFSGSEFFTDISAQLNGTASLIDTIKVDDEYCVNVCNIGFDSEVADKMTSLKKRFGTKFAYDLAVAFKFFRKIKRRIKLVFDDGEVVEDDIVLASFANGNAYGGGYFAAPRALLTDGLIDVCTAKTGHLNFLKLIGVYKKGKHLDMPEFAKYIWHRTCKSVRVTAEKPASFCQDGEISTRKEITIGIAPLSLKIVVPRGAAIPQAIPSKSGA